MPYTSVTSQTIDDVLAGTFPASDPPAWTPGMARPAPEVADKGADTGTSARDTSDARASDGSDASRPANSARTFGEALASLIGAAGIVLLFPLAILAVGTPLALGVRGVLEFAKWLVAIGG